MPLDFFGAVPGVGDEGLGFGRNALGGGMETGLGAILSGVGGLMGDTRQGRDPKQRMNDLRGSLTGFLAQGGGQRNAAAAKGQFINNALLEESELGQLLSQTRGPQFTQTLRSAEGLGPGGGLGVTRDLKSYLQEEDPEFENEGSSILRKILGTAAGLGGKLLTGGAF